MLEDIAGRVVSGALFGVGAGLAMRVLQGTRKQGERAREDQNVMAPLRPVAKTAMKGVIVAAERVRGVLAEAREGIEDLYAEAQSETHGATSGASANRNGETQMQREGGNIPFQP